MKKIIALILSVFLMLASAAIPVHAEESPLTRHGITVTPSAEVFNDDVRLTYCLYSAIAKACHSLQNVVQAHNPEYFTFDAKTQSLGTLFVYMNYYGVGSRADIRQVVEDYTDTILAVLQAAYPDLNYSIIKVCWKIPLIHKENLYTATFWCEPQDGVIVRGPGDGVLYQ